MCWFTYVLPRCAQSYIILTFNLNISWKFPKKKHNCKLIISFPPPAWVLLSSGRLMQRETVIWYSIFVDWLIKMTAFQCHNEKNSSIIAADEASQQTNAFFLNACFTHPQTNNLRGTVTTILVCSDHDRVAEKKHHQATAPGSVYTFVVFYMNSMMLNVSSAKCRRCKNTLSAFFFPFSLRFIRWTILKLLQRCQACKCLSH